MTGVRRPIRRVIQLPTAIYRSGSGGGGPTAPGAPTGVTAADGDSAAFVSFSAPASDGGSAITGYRITSSPGGLTATGASSPIAITGLTNGTAYTFTVQAQNAIGFGTASAASNSVTPSLNGTATLAITAKSVASSGTNVNGIRLRRAGTGTTIRAGAAFTEFSNEWVSAGATATIGDGYEARANLVSGTPNQNVDSVWRRITGDLDFTMVLTGSFTVEIRRANGSAVLAGPITVTVT